MVGGKRNSGSDVPPFLSTKRMSPSLSVPETRSKGATCRLTVPSPERVAQNTNHHADLVTQRLFLTCLTRAFRQKGTYEDAEECKSRLPFIESVVVLEDQRKRLPELASRFPLHEHKQVLFTPKNK